ncbi:hypothetical protein [Occultella kanbiaonis]|uniref:hypothetical protein n=1 Tax=Occultella kanbiaonis TaxID=2675754 RepID=UPI0013D64784|nr:hypothetical protein [Occultella kanbiaonis]
MTSAPVAGPTFFAYASRPPLRAETMREAIAGLNTRGQQAVGWEELQIDGRLLVGTITERIRASSSLIAEVSSMNPKRLV